MRYPFKNLGNFTLPRLLDRSNDLFAHNPSFGKVGQKAMSYAEFNQNVQRMVTLLLSYGLGKGDKILLLSENMPNWGIAYFAITYFGGVVVPVLPDFLPSDVHRIIEHSGAKAAFVSPKHQSTIESSPHDNILFSINLETLQIIGEAKSQEATNDEAVKEDDLAAIIYTSGTTGNSKGVMLTHKNLVTNAMSAHTHVNILENDVFLSILPLAHTFEGTVGLLIPVLNGCSVYYIDKIPTPSVLIKSFEIVKPTMMVSVPLVIEKIYKNKVLPNLTSSPIKRFLHNMSFTRKILNRIAGKKLIQTFGGRLRFFGLGGAAIAPYVEQFLIEAKFPFIVGYGLTETAPLLCGSILGGKIKFRSTGVPMDGVSIKIKNPDPVTGQGEIIAQSPSVMLGYYKDEAKTAEVMEDGWFLTGDLGYLDDEGYLFINGRSKNMLLGPSGENIYPEQIEGIINQNELVLDSLVMQDKDARLIAKIHLNYEVVDVNDKEKINKLLEDIRQDVNSQLASFSKIIRFVEQEEEFVKTPTKKIKRFLYAEQ